MQYLTEWITNIILFILLAIVIDLLLPKSSLQRYSKMVVGLLLIIIILSPVLNIFNKNVDEILSSLDLSSSSEEKKVEILIENKKKEIQASQRAYILEQMAVQMKTQVEEELVKDHGLQVQNLQLDVSSEDGSTLSISDINAVHVLLKEQAEDMDNQIRVQTVMIDTTKPLKEDHEQDYHHIQLYLSKKWEIESEKIKINLEGGEM